MTTTTAGLPSSDYVEDRTTAEQPPQTLTEDEQMIEREAVTVTGSQYNGAERCGHAHTCPHIHNEVFLLPQYFIFT